MTSYPRLSSMALGRTSDFFEVDVELVFQFQHLARTLHASVGQSRVTQLKILHGSEYPDTCYNVCPSEEAAYKTKARRWAF